MAVKIRLRKTGRNKVPTYRVIVAEERSKRDGHVIENLGTYQPASRTKQSLAINRERIAYWLSKGALPTATVKGLIKRASRQVPA